MFFAPAPISWQRAHCFWNRVPPRASVSSSADDCALAGTENRIAVERRRYNETVKAWNITIRRFPTNIFAGMFGFEKAPFYEVPPEAREVPKVTF